MESNGWNDLCENWVLKQSKKALKGEDRFNLWTTGRQKPTYR